MTWQPQHLGPQDGRTVVVTGANSGIGLETARELIARGAHVVLAVRDLAKGEQARAEVTGGSPGSASLVELDLADLDSVATAAEQLAAEHPAVHALVANAGIMGGPQRATAQGFELQMGTNHLGHAALVSALWPQVTEARGRVVLLSSIAARQGLLTARTSREDLVAPRPYLSTLVYANSKQANLMFAQELHRRATAAGSPVSVVAAHPGVSATNLFTTMLPPFARPLLEPISQVALRLSTQPAEAGALATLRALDSSTPSGAFVGPKRLNQSRGRPELLAVYPNARNQAAAARLWQLTEELLGVPLPV